MSKQEDYRILFELGEDEATNLLAFLVSVPVILPEYQDVVMGLQNGILAALESEGEEDYEEEED